MLKKITPVVLLSLFFSAQVFSQCAVNNLTGNQVISTNTTWNAGTYNISGDFTINAGVTLTVNYSGNCPLTINANNINILGTINANGAGGANSDGVVVRVNGGQCHLNSLWRRRRIQQCCVLHVQVIHPFAHA